MVKKHINAIAAIIRKHGPACKNGEEAREYNKLAEDLATVLASTNSRFDRAKFLAACGVCDD